MAPALSNADTDKTHKLATSPMESMSERRANALLACTAELKLDYFGSYRVAHNLQFPYGDLELEPQRAGATGLDIKHPVTVLDRRSVRVPRYNDPESGCHRIYIQLRQVVKNVNEDIADLENFRFRNIFRPAPLVVIAAYYRNRRESLQFLKYAGVANVSCMDNEITSAQKRDRLGPQ